MFWCKKVLPPIGSLVSFNCDEPFQQTDYLGFKNAVVVYYSKDEFSVFCVQESSLFQLRTREIVFIRELTNEELLTCERPEAQAIALRRLGWMK